MTMSTSITLGNASYGFREYGLRQFFEASKEIGIAEVEIEAVAAHLGLGVGHEMLRN